MDAYNANPSSMKVALENFNSFEAKSKTVILGDMFELGDESLIEHQNITDLTASLNFDNSFLVGENFAKSNSNVLQFDTYQKLEEYIKKNPLENQSILIKGSRGMRLERILDFIN